MVIDFHAHCFPEAIAARAIATLSKNAGNAIPFTDGTVDSLLGVMRAAGVDASVVLNIATNAKQQKNVNDFAGRINATDIIAFGSVHPDAPDALEELERIRDMGLKGVKFHPDYQGFFVDDPKAFPLYKKAAALGLITSFHAGVDVEFYEEVHCTPERLARALPQFDGAPVVAAHMGGYLMWSEAERHLVGRDIYIDTSYSYGRMPCRQALKMARAHGTDKMLLGSDLPWSGIDQEILFVKSWDLSPDEEQMILGGNAKRLLGL